MKKQAEIIVTDSAAQLAKRGAEVFRHSAIKAAEDRGRFVAAISGGSTPRAMHRLLAEEPYLSAVPWSKVHLFWADERLVPAHDSASNYGAALQDFLKLVPIPAGQLHPMVPSGKPQSSAQAYQKQLIDFFGGPEAGYPVFDLIFLGIGTDGHTASIFPADRTAVETRSWVVAVKGGNPNVHRLTLTAPVLNGARCVVFLVAGDDKAEIVQTILTDATAEMPAGRIQPTRGRLLWLMERKAAARLPQKGLDFKTSPD